MNPEGSIFQIESRLRAPEQKWAVCAALRPETREAAEELVQACTRAMPMKDFRVQEVRDEDIPF